MFAGVYAAFMLNNYQNHWQERQRRDQILDWAQAKHTETLASFDGQYAYGQQMTAEFDRRVKADEAPPIYPFKFSKDYNPTDFTGLLQSDGFDLLESQTARDLREVEGTLRQFID